jgi:predicted ATPase/DNA-binding CsgD family transcriptional regulator/GAF domain-containing protein
MIQFSEYKLQQRLVHENGRELFKATTIGNDLPALVELLHKDKFTNQDLSAFKYGYHLSTKIESDAILRPLELIDSDENLAIVYEYFEGQPLRDIIQSERLSLAEFLEIAIHSGQSLADIHAYGVIHKSLQPENILVNRCDGQVKITNFSASSLLKEEEPWPIVPRADRGFLSYISPEQTGRMNRVIDYRADYYSLGVILYELLMGWVPFQEGDPADLLYAHITQAPVPPHILNRKIPQVVSDIIMKLVAKNAEDRYQSMVGFIHDLERCRSQVEATGVIEGFAIGEQDVFEQFHLPRKLYGRESEVKELMASVQRVFEGTSGFLLVSGYAGIGKTTLVQEVFKSAALKRGLYTSGKFEQYKRDIPYYALIQAFQKLIYRLLTSDPAQLDSWRARLLNALGQSSQVIVDVIPDLALIIGQQPPVPKLEGTETQNRFNRLFLEFVQAFADKESPLILFIDDLQWADLASLNLIEHLVTDPTRQSLLLIGAYRDNEVDSSHPLSLTLQRIQQVQSPLRQFSLGPLNKPQIRALVADVIHPTVEPIDPLTDLLLEKTQGNPFFIIRFMKGLYEDGLISFERGQGGWHWDIDKVKQASPTENVIEFLASQIRRLPTEQQDVLKLAACLGNTFDLRQLAIIQPAEEDLRQTPLNTTLERLHPLFQAGLIIPLSDTYKFVGDASNPLADSSAYKFVHDRIQQAAYSLIPGAELKPIHWRIGQQLLAALPPQLREENLFEIVTHLNKGAEDSAAEVEKYELARLNLQAAQKAKNAIAYPQLLQFARQGEAILPKDAWEANFDLAQALHKELSEAEYLNGNFKTAEAILDVLLDKVNTPIDIADIHCRRLEIYLIQSRLDEAIELGLKGLHLFDIDINPNPTLADVLQEGQNVQTLLAGREIRSLIHLPEMKDPNVLAAQNLLMQTFPAAFSTRPLLLNLIVLNLIKLALRHGNSFFTPFTYAIHGLMLVVQEEYAQANEFGKLAVDLVEKQNNVALRGRTYHLYASLVMPHVEPFDHTTPLFDVAYRALLEAGDYNYLAYLIFSRLPIEIAGGTKVDALIEKFSNLLPVVDKTGYTEFANLLRITLGWLWNLRGETDNPYSLGREPGEEAKLLASFRETNNKTALLVYYLNKHLVYAVRENYEAALQLEADIAGNAGTYPGSLLIEAYWLLDGIAIAQQYTQATTTEKRNYIKKLDDYLEKFGKLAASCPENFLDRYHLLHAEISRILDSEQEAAELYDQGIEAARANGLSFTHALGCELAAKFYHSRGKDRLAGLYMLEAIRVYEDWGARAKAAILKRKHRALLEPLFSLTDAPAAQSQPVDVDMILKTFETLSAETDFEPRLKNILAEIVKHTGARSGKLLSLDEDRLLFEVSCYLESRDFSFFEATPLSEYDGIPASMANYIYRARKDILLENATLDETFTHAAYIIENQPKSIFCAPLQNKGRLAGILYLENNLTAGVFTPDTRKLLSLLLPHLAIVLENAALTLQMRQDQGSRATIHPESGVKRQAPDTYWADPLTERELEVLNQLGKGLTNKQIARALFISPGTVKTHTLSIYLKLDVKNRTEAVVQAKAYGIIE